MRCAGRHWINSGWWYLLIVKSRRMQHKSCLCISTELDTSSVVFHLHLLVLLFSGALWHFPFTVDASCRSARLYRNAQQSLFFCHCASVREVFSKMWYRVESRLAIWKNYFVRNCRSRGQNHPCWAFQCTPRCSDYISWLNSSRSKLLVKNLTRACSTSKHGTLSGACECCRMFIVYL